LRSPSPSLSAGEGSAGPPLPLRSGG
jgi:hypothetical protein